MNPATPLEIVREVLPNVDLLLVMSVDPGFGGTVVHPVQLGQAAPCKSDVGRDRIEGGTAGGRGVDAGNAAAIVAAGASVLVAGSAVYGHDGGAAGGVRAIRQAIGE